MSEKNRKATTAIMLTVWIGLVVFVLLFLISCNGIKNALKSYGGSEKGMGDIVAAVTEMNAKGSNIQERLVSLNIEEGTAFYVFADDAGELYEYYRFAIPPTWDVREYEYDLSGSGVASRIIPRPPDCPEKGTCICLCNELLGGYSKEPYKDTGKLANPLNCGKKIECRPLSGVNFQEKTDLAGIMGKDSYDGLLKRADASTDHTFVFHWEGGFSFWRAYADSSAAQDMVYAGYKHLILSRYVDLYVVKNDDGTIKFCFADDCARE
jgi:hypothetical protein